MRTETVDDRNYDESMLGIFIESPATQVQISVLYSVDIGFLLPTRLVPVINSCSGDAARIVVGLRCKLQAKV